jgi:aminoglycoside 6-adenylyltransferase
MNAGSSTELLGRMIEWAQSDLNVIALVMTGSRARRHGESVDEFSDFDLEIIAENPDQLATNDEWLRSFGPILVYLPLSEGQAHATRLVFYEDGMKVDFSLCTRERITDMLGANGLDDLYERGYRVLLDKDGITSGLPAATGGFPTTKLPTQHDFSAMVNEFWFEAAHIPRYLLRGELWVVKTRDWTMKQLLLQMLEWHAIARQERPVDVWHIGTHMKDWAGEKTWQELQAVYSHFDAPDSWRGLIATTTLFRRLAKEVATAIGIEYPAGPDTSVSGYVAGFQHRL